MEKAKNIIRSSLHSFFASYHTFASIATVLILPASAATLLSSALNPPNSSSCFHEFISIQKPPFFHIFYLKLFNSHLSFLLNLPFTLTFLCLAKACIIHAAHDLRHQRQSSPPISSFLHLYRPLALTHFFNAFLILSTNAIFFIIIFIIFNSVESLGFDSRSFVVLLSAFGVVLHSMIIANTYVICNLATVVAAMENCSAYGAVMKAGVLVRERAVVALSVALPTNLGMAVLETVFQVRVMRPYHQANQFDLSLLCEGFTITYMYSILTVLDIIITCCFFKSCKNGIFSDCDSRFDHEDDLRVDEKGRG